MKEKVVIKGYAKINLGLDVVGKLENGYHLLRTLMQQVNLYDELTLTVAEENLSGEKIFLCSDSEVVPADPNNLAYKAAALMMEHYKIPGAISIHLKKNIPVAAGMAGGSTDAAAVMLGMKELFKLSASEEELCGLGVKIGADVPFCIMGGTALAEGIGEKLTPIRQMPGMYVLITKPPVMVSTKYVFENLNISELAHPDTDAMLQAFEENDLKRAISYIGNVLETVTAKKYPIIDILKRDIMDCGAMGAFMSGSGPTVFGIFEEEKETEKAAKELKKKHPDVFVKACGLI